MGEVILRRLGMPVKELKTSSGKVIAYSIFTDPHSVTLFTAHLDTVHQTDGINSVIFDEELEWMWKEDGQPLGADDGAGIWILYNMIKAGVSGSYLFTVGEECGGVGAKAVAAHHSKWLANFGRAIAFDRMGTTSVITHQRHGRCCSDQFAIALSAALTEGMAQSDYLPECIYQPDDGGVYTDTAEFTNLIPECTNISVGYANAHTGREELDVGYLKGLLATCLMVVWNTLPIGRDPATVAD